MSPEDLDTACKLGFGHAMGPLATTDLTGVDLSQLLSRLAARTSEARVPAPTPPADNGRAVSAEAAETSDA